MKQKTALFLILIFLALPLLSGHASEALPDPAELLAAEGVLKKESDDFFTYAYPLPENPQLFFTFYTAFAKSAGYRLEKETDAVTGEMLYYFWDDQERVVLLVPNSQGEMLLIVEKGVNFTSDAPIALSPTAAPGKWVLQSVESDCPACIGGVCDLCNGSGVYRAYGTTTDCSRECKVCDGKGYTESLRHVFVPD